MQQQKINVQFFVLFSFKSKGLFQKEEKNAFMFVLLLMQVMQKKKGKFAIYKTIL